MTNQESIDLIQNALDSEDVEVKQSALKTLLEGFQKAMKPRKRRRNWKEILAEQEAATEREILIAPDFVHSCAMDVLNAFDERLKEHTREAVDKCLKKCLEKVEYVADMEKGRWLFAFATRINFPVDRRNPLKEVKRQLVQFFYDRQQKWKRDLDIDHVIG